LRKQQQQQQQPNRCGRPNIYILNFFETKHKQTKVLHEFKKKKIKHRQSQQSQKQNNQPKQQKQQDTHTQKR